MGIEERAIEECLSNAGYHPDYKARMQEKVDALSESLKDKEPHIVRAGVAELRSLINDLVLMQGKYFDARVRFLAKVARYLQDRPEENVRVADDGCGTGMDLYVLDSLLGNTLSLTGVDINETSLAMARQRVPHVELTRTLSENTYDVIYSDFFSASDVATGNIFDIANRGVKNLRALRSPGVVLHNADMDNVALQKMAFGAQFSRIVPPELLARIEDNHDCYFYRYEKG